MNLENKRDSIEANYINGNIQDAIKGFKKLSVSDRKEFALDAMYRTYLMEAGAHMVNAYDFAKFLIENL